MLQVQIGKTVLHFGLVVVDMQNGFLSKGGSYDKLGMKIVAFRKIIPRVRNLITFCRKEDIPIFYTEAVRERSGIDLLTNIHMILPRRRKERLNEVHAVVGGFHLPADGGIFEKAIDSALTELQKIDPEYVIPCHCTGWKATNKIIDLMPEKFIQSAVCTTFIF